VYRKLFIVLVILLMLVNVPVYAEDEEVYTLKKGKVYEFKFRANLTLSDVVNIGFSDYVLYGYSNLTDYDSISSYGFYGTGTSRTFVSVFTMFVYNCSDSDVTMVITDGVITNYYEYDSPFSFVMYDASEEYFKITNTTDTSIKYRELQYNEYDGTITYRSSSETLKSGGSALYSGKGLLLLPVKTGNVQYNVTLEGVYEVNNYIRKGFFRVPPWILETDLGVIIRALLEQLSMLLPVGLVILSVFLLISLIRYIVRSYL